MKNEAEIVERLTKIGAELNLTPEQKTELVNGAVETAAKVLISAFYMCHLSKGINSTVEDNGVKYEINFKKL